MKAFFFLFALLLLTLLLPLRGEPQHAPQQAPPPQEERKDAPLPTVVLISLPACVTAVMEDPQRAERLFLAYPYPRHAFLLQLEKEIEKELKAIGGARMNELLQLRRLQNLVSKVEYLYPKVNSNAQLRKAFLRLNGLADDLPARADDNVYEILDAQLWMPDAVLKRRALRQRPETRIAGSNVIRLLIQIQLDLAAALFAASADQPEMRTAALIELANIAGTPPPEIDCGRAPSSIPGNAAPVYQETSFPILDLYTDLFRLTDWSPF